MSLFEIMIFPNIARRISENSVNFNSSDFCCSNASFKSKKLVSSESA